MADVLDSTDAAIEHASAADDAAALVALADLLDEAAAERGSEWRGLAIAAARARALAGAPVAETPPAPVAASASASRYAGWWIRLVAFVLDVVLLSIVYGLLFEILPGVAAVLLWLGPLAYFAGMHAANDGATVGKAVFGIALRSRDERRVGAGPCVVRAVATTVLWATLIGGLIDTILLVADRRKQSVHDKIAGTFVVRTRRARSASVLEQASI